MKWWRMFVLHFAEAFMYRSISVVWFMLTVVNAALYLLFWRGAYKGSAIAGAYSLNDISLYYFFLIVAGSLFTSHIEESVANEDIKDGGLVKFLTRPMPYLGFKFLHEVPWRLIQGGMGGIVLALFYLWGGAPFSWPDPRSVIPGLLIAICAYVIAFLFKMIVGVSAFWITDYFGLLQLVEVIMLVFAGYVMPVSYYPDMLQRVAFMLPFVYIIYYPVMVWMGKIPIPGIWQILGTQLVWIAALWGTYRVLWNAGVRRFTGVGQ